MTKFREYAKKMPAQAQLEFAPLLDSLPPHLESEIRILKAAQGTVLVRMEEPAEKVFVLLEGVVKAVDQRASGTVYAFAQFHPPALFGEFEAFAGSAHYKGTLICQSACVFGVLPVQSYLEWVQRNVSVLFAQTQKITRQLIEQAGAQRSFLFLEGRDRMAVFLSESCLEVPKGKKVCLKITRQRIADETGFSVKTVGRVLKAFLQQGLISFEGRAICLSPPQRRRLEAMAAHIMSGETID